MSLDHVCVSIAGAQHIMDVLFCAMCFYIVYSERGDGRILSFIVTLSAPWCALSCAFTFQTAPSFSSRPPSVLPTEGFRSPRLSPYFIFVLDRWRRCGCAVLGGPTRALSAGTPLPSSCLLASVASAGGPLGGLELPHK